MVISYFNIKSIVLIPGETYSPLLINTDTVLTLAVSFKRLQLISGRDQQVIEINGGVKDIQAAHSGSGYILPPAAISVQEKILGIPAFPCFDHDSSVCRLT
jgi:hypothetical protein